MRRILLLTIGVTLLALPGAAAIAQDKPMIEEVKARGVLRAGVKNDAPHMGFVDDKGDLAGFEIDLITDIAKQLGVKLEFEPVKASNRVQLLVQKKIDLIIATVSHYRSRDRVVDFSIPYLYTPQTLLVKTTSGIRSMDDLVGKRVAVDAGSGAVKKFLRYNPRRWSRRSRAGRKLSLPSSAAPSTRWQPITSCSPACASRHPNPTTMWC